LWSKKEVLRMTDHSGGRRAGARLGSLRLRIPALSFATDWFAPRPASRREREVGALSGAPGQGDGRVLRQWERRRVAKVLARQANVGQPPIVERGEQRKIAAGLDYPPRPGQKAPKTIHLKGAARHGNLRLDDALAEAPLDDGRKPASRCYSTARYGPAGRKSLGMDATGSIIS
jgi:hypothetical protein